MKTSSCKAKGRNLQKEVVRQILEHFPKLSDKDVRSNPMGVTGSDVWLSREAQLQFPFAVECKCQESISIWQALDQCETNGEKEGNIPCLVFRRNRSKAYAVVELDVFMEMAKDRYWEKVGWKGD